MTATSEIWRILTCQGSAQLVTVLAALRQRQQELGQAPESCRDILVFYDLFAPADQLVEFRETLLRMAGAHASWQAIVWLDPAEIKQFGKLLRRWGLRSVRRKLCQRFGVRTVQEVFVARNWQLGNQLVMNCYPEATQICYGDTIGVYFTEGYFGPAGAATHPQRSASRWTLATAFRTVRSAMFGPGRLEVLPFDHGYLAAADLFGEVAPFPVSINDRAITKEILRAIARTIRPQVPEALRAGDGEMVLILTANFSEAQSMNRADELAAYLEFLKPRVAREAKIVLKPHPRDNREKIAALADELRGHFRDVWVFDDVRFFYLPFELLLLTALADAEFHLARFVRLICFSSSCLGPALLFGLRAEIGFGPELVNRAFAPTLRKSRLRHEADLAAALERVLHSQVSRNTSGTN